MNDLAPHADTLAHIIGALFFLILALIAFVNTMIWRNIFKLNERVDSSIKMHYECQTTLPEKYLCREEFTNWIRNDWKPFLERRGHDWEALWSAFHQHNHNGSGRVIR